MALTGKRLAGVTRLVLAGLLALGIWVMVMVLAARPQLAVRIDLSPQGRFTFTPDTEELVAELRANDRQLEIHTFYEPLVGQAQTEEQHHRIAMERTLQGLTRDLLRLYEHAGGGAIRVIDHDLLREVQGSAAAAKTLALDKRNSIALRLDKRTKTLSLNVDLAEIDVGMTQQPMPGTKRALPVFRQFKGEEAISSAIRSLLVEGNPTVYFVNSYGSPSITDAIGDSYSNLAGALHDEGFKIQTLDLEKQQRIPEDAAMLALMEPRREMSERAAEVLELWLRRGGRMFLNVSWMLEPEDYNPRLDELGKRLGFVIGEDLVLHLVQDPRNPANGIGGEQAQNLQVELNPVHKVTRPLVNNNVTVIPKLAREIRRRSAVDPDGVRIDLSLLRTPPWAWLERRDRASPNGGGTVDFQPPASRDAFDSRCVGAAIDIDSQDPKRPGHLLIVGGIAFNNIGFGINQSLVMNAFNWLCERKELVGVRGKGVESRQLRIAPQSLDRVLWLLVVGVPGALLALGALVLWCRSR